jgi:hypothetical protein
VQGREEYGGSPLRRKKRGPFGSAQGLDDSVGVVEMKDETDLGHG